MHATLINAIAFPVEFFLNCKILANLKYSCPHYHLVFVISLIVLHLSMTVDILSLCNSTLMKSKN